MTEESEAVEIDKSGNTIVVAAFDYLVGLSNKIEATEQGRFYNTLTRRVIGAFKIAEKVADAEDLRLEALGIRHPYMRGKIKTAVAGAFWAWQNDLNPKADFAIHAESFSGSCLTAFARAFTAIDFVDNAAQLVGDDGDEIHGLSLDPRTTDAVLSFSSIVEDTSSH
jgi:hypothetical protein